MKTKNEKSVSELIKLLDVEVSKFVRYRAADKFGYCHCISCGQRIHWRLAQCAHFKDRSNMATRFYLPNLAPACGSCNMFDEDQHLTKWAAKMSPEQLEDLEQRAKSLMKWTRGELEYEIDFYKIEFEKLVKSKKIFY